MILQDTVASLVDALIVWLVEEVVWCEEQWTHPVTHLTKTREKTMKALTYIIC